MSKYWSYITGTVATLKAAISPENEPDDQALETSLREAYGATVDIDDEEGWRKLSGNAERDLAPMTQDRMQSLAVYLWESNLLANRIIELPVAYMLSEGVDVVANDEEVSEWITKFWNDPINEMDIKLTSKVRQLSLFGEQCYPTFVNNVSGHVRLGYLDPANIRKVVADPDNPEQPILVLTTRNKKGRYKKYRIIVNGDDNELFTQRTAAIRAHESVDGECFYFNVNSLSNGSRGRSDLLAQVDWLDAYDQFLFGEIDRVAFLRAFIWDVEMVGATPDEVKKRAREITAPSPGSTRVHNDAEKWTAVSPNIDASDSGEQARLLRNHILGGSTLPEHWYGGGGDVNRAVGAEMGDPTYKMFTMRQTFLKYMLTKIITYQIRQRVLASNGPEPDMHDEKYQFSVQFSDMVTKDVTKYASALQAVTVSVTVLIRDGLISRSRGLQIIEKISSRIGVEFDADTELDAAMADVKATEAEQARKDTYTETDEEDDTVAA